MESIPGRWKQLNNKSMMVLDQLDQMWIPVFRDWRLKFFGWPMALD
jgi:hypothetical protein